MNIEPDSSSSVLMLWDLTVVRSRGEIRGGGEALHRFQQVTVVKAPGAHCPVVAARNQHTSVTGERKTHDRLLLKLAQRLPRDTIP